MYLFFGYGSSIQMTCQFPLIILTPKLCGSAVPGPDYADEKVLDKDMKSLSPIIRVRTNHFELLMAIE